LRAQCGGFRFELLDREPARERGVVQETVLVAAEEIARDMAAGSFIGLGADEEAEVGIERHRGLGEQPLHGVGLDVGMVLQLAPHRELGGVIGAEGEGGHGIEADAAGAVGVEQFGRQLAEAQALPDVAFGGAEAGRNGVDRGAGIDQRRHGNEFVGRVHRRPDRVLGERGLDRVFGLFDLARDPGVGGDDALGRELLQDSEAAAAGIDFVDASRPDPRRMNDEVLENAVGADAGFEGGILGRRGRGLAHIGRGEGELAESDVLDVAAGGHGGDSWDGRAKAVSRPGEPVTDPLQPFSSRCRRNRSHGKRQGPQPSCCVRDRHPQGRRPQGSVAGKAIEPGPAPAGHARNPLIGLRLEKSLQKRYIIL
jgi:hypothetical protein